MEFLTSSLRRHRPSPAMMVALLALFVALGGSSYAALRVSSNQIVDNSVRSKDIRNGSLGRIDFRDKHLRNRELVKEFSANNSDSGKLALATCPQGKQVIGASGGINGTDHTGVLPNQLATVAMNGVYIGTKAAFAVAYEIPPGTTQTWNVEVRAVCANAD